MATINPPSAAESQTSKTIERITSKTRTTTTTTTSALTVQQNCNWGKLNSNQKRVQKRSYHSGIAQQRIILIINMMILTVLQTHQQTHNFGAMALPISEIQRELLLNGTHTEQAQTELNKYAETPPFSLLTKNPSSLPSSISSSSSSSPSGLASEAASTFSTHKAHARLQTGLSWMEMPFYTRQKVRLRKRAHSSFNAVYRHEMSNQNMEWFNPCGGIWQEDIAQQQQQEWRRHRQHRQRGQRCIRYKKLLRTLQMKLGQEFRRLRDEQSVTRKARPRLALPNENFAAAKAVVINIGGMQTWELHNETYNFLPKLDSLSNITLRRWHRDLQIYVAAFAYMRRAQVHFDYHKTMQESLVAMELQQLKQSARQMLCYVETAINGTNLVYGRDLKHHQQQQEQKQIQSHHGKSKTKNLIGIKTISRLLMENKLKSFQTPITQLNNEHSAGGTTKILDESWSKINIDIRFLKHHYIDYLRNLVRLLRKHAAKKCFNSKSINTQANSNAANPITSSSSSSSKTSTKSPATEALAATKRRKPRKQKITKTTKTNDFGSTQTLTKLHQSKSSS